MSDKKSNNLFMVLAVLAVLIGLAGTFMFMDDAFSPETSNEYSQSSTSGEVNVEILPQDSENLIEGENNEEG